MIYKEIQKLTWYCRVTDVKVKRNHKNNSDFVVVKFGKHDNGELLRSFVLDESWFPYLQKEMQSRRLHTIDRVAIQPQNQVYHILTWDDVDKGICNREHVGEVQRDNEGNPIKFTQIVVFGNIDNKNKRGFTISETLDKEYIEVNSPYAQRYLDFNNQQSFAQLQMENRIHKEREEQIEYDAMMNSLYEASEERRCKEMYMTEEERIMDALENGDAEIYGF